ncbi:ankyrin repeat-containing domain protein [Lasiosphaeria hispida]|uniref:Ankyrin repeat-containing domain protein n=1 Tax=Lasiosphaeria hispida TaxID=260671 RepID=A0AAJ0HBM8_9PEZI|nr:ankyrin repeat-containing domain protein [Lasiosphaeria hispida]
MPELRASRWFRRHRPGTGEIPRGHNDRRASATETTWPPNSLISQTNDSLPVSSDSIQLLEPPPPYSPPSEDSPSPIVFTEQLAPPPDYQPQSPNEGPRSKSAAKSWAEEQQILAEVFTCYPWRRNWGPRPTSLASALNKAALVGNYHIILALCNAGAEVRGNRHSASHSSTAIHEALRGPKPWIALALIGRHRASDEPVQELLESLDIVGCLPLHVAAEAGETEIAHELIQMGTSVDALDHVGRSPLHMAARYGRVGTIQMLLDNGADATIINEKLWQRARNDPKLELLLGSYTRISQILQGVLDKRRRQTNILSPADNTQDTINQSECSDNEEGHAPEGSSSVRRKAPMTFKVPLQDTQNDTDHLIGFLPTRRRHSVSVDNTLRWDQTASHLAAIYGDNEVEMARRILSLRLQATIPRRPRESLRGSQEYTVWAQNCETLLAESRAQREKNTREQGNALGL